VVAIGPDLEDHMTIIIDRKLGGDDDDNEETMILTPVSGADEDHKDTDKNPCRSPLAPPAGARLQPRD
jgi:hypothetical protein